MDDDHNITQDSYAQIRGSLEAIRRSPDYQSKKALIDRHVLERAEELLQDDHSEEGDIRLIAFKQLICRKYPFEPSLFAPLLLAIIKLEATTDHEAGIAAPPPSPELGDPTGDLRPA